MKNIEDVLDELKKREPIFHHPEKFGNTREAIKLMMVPDFWEVGASGQIYDKEVIIKTLLKRYGESPAING